MTAGAGGRTSRELLRAAASTARASSVRAGIEIRPLETLSQMTAACDVLEQVWGIRPGQNFDVGPHLLRALGHGGNYLVGAYRRGGAGPDGDGSGSNRSGSGGPGSDRLVGASAAFFTEPLGSAMHSHITGVLPGIAGSGVGAAVKWHQRQWALERGLSRITWTFDPLVARNAFFNLTRLGARPETYFIDFYGLMDDGANHGQPSDRVEIVWDLTSGSAIGAEELARHVGHAGSGPDVGAVTAAGAATVLSVAPDGAPVPGRLPPPGAEMVLIGIPKDIEELRRVRPGLALAWRHELRAALALLMADTSWHVTGFARSGWYLLEREAPVRPEKRKVGR